ncbi:FAD-dependent oxidoreductase [Pelodictyon luteolum]|uniref:Gamma-carotene desaturase n=1 Tax=Chlorobium luteolum (strain DSM 273 / BCRC 81028 / 2530) TaxID=319225 RepID=Q3B5Q8_CHLL3|nr:FAD-dependent oxidoreductase [Pelodictyon luteolum]ABB23323.1 gamma-carotene desaturase [Pelodictyon luteolum DSM 273]
MDRRDFIRKIFSRTGIGLGVASAASAGLVGSFQPRKELYEDGRGSAGGAEGPAVPRNCVVIGGGLAGISAAMELASKGMQVTLVESSTSLGGKLTGWEIDALGSRFPVEHGFHGFFDQYYNLNAMFEQAGISKEVFDASPGYPVMFKERPREIYGQTPKVFPFNILSVVSQSRSLDIASFLRQYRGLPPVVDMFRYDYSRTFAELDGIDFMEYCRRGEILPSFIDTVLHPFADATMNRMEVLSAAEAIRYFHFYFMGSPEGLAFRITNRDCMTAIINPLESKLRELGVRVLAGHRVLRLEHDGARISGVRIGGPASGGLVLHVDGASIPDEGWVSMLSREGVPVLVAREGSGYRALDGRCTHMGCPVSPDPSGDGFYCPCHAGRFNASGEPIGGPPPTPLPPLSVTLEGGTLVLRSGETGGDEVLQCEYCVLAADVRGTKDIVKRSGLSSPAFEKSVASLGEADPYAVYRLWLDRPLEGEGYPFYTVSGYTYTDSVSIYSAFQEPFISWAGERGGSVVELHAYAIAPEDMRSDDEIRQAMLRELHSLFPETLKASVLHEVFMVQSNFTRWAPGEHAGRPGPETPFPNLFLAGDWVRVDAPVFLMEAAAFTGRMAANAVFRNEGVRSVPLPIVPMGGIFS